MAKKLNLIEIIQKWMDTMAGQTFMNYAYSWGAAVVILGTLFKLTHLPGANLMLFIGMGTEVFVFIVAGFERVTEKVPEISGTGASLSSETVEELAAVASAAAQNGGGGGVILGGGGPAVVGGGGAAVVGEGGAPVVGGGGGTVVIGGGGAPAGGTIVIGGGGAPVEGAEAGEGSPVVVGGGSGAPVILGGGGVIGGGVVGGGVTEAAQIQATDPATVEEAVKNYAEQLTELTEVLGRVKKQAERMSTDSEEMENLNRTLTGIATVYELQLRNISKQVSTIEQIDEQTRRMAQQIEELNNVYARMIKALTVNVVGPITPQQQEEEK